MTMRIALLLLVLVALPSSARERVGGSDRFGRSRGLGASSSLFSLLPGGPAASLVCTNNLHGSLGEAVTVVRASTRPCQCIGSSTTLAASVPCIEAGGLSIYGPRTGQTAGDTITVATTGWPTSSGEVSLTYTPSGTTGVRVLLDTRADGAVGPGLLIFLNGADLYALGYNGVGSVGPSITLAWSADRAYRIRVSWAGGTATLFRDDVAVAAGGFATPASHRPTAVIGSGIDGTGHANGLISDLTVKR